ncbi:hypothetical protein PV325_010521, partial [Microctonus aethiopoides]
MSRILLGIEIAKTRTDNWIEIEEDQKTRSIPAPVTNPDAAAATAAAEALCIVYCRFIVIVILGLLMLKRSMADYV